MINFILYPSKFWHCFATFLIVYGIVGAGLLWVSIYVLNWVNSPEIAILSTGFSMVCGLYIYYRMNGPKWKKSLFTNPVARHISCAYIILFSTLMIAFYFLTPHELKEKGGVYTHPWLHHLTMFIFLWFAAIGEEVMFRGVFFNTLKERYNPWLVIVVISILFGLGHASYFLHIVSAFISSIIFSVVYYRTKSLLLCILIHFFGDFTTEVLVNFQLDYYTPIVGSVILCISLLGLFLLDSRYRQKA